jgi:hypothetical protein
MSRSRRLGQEAWKGLSLNPVAPLLFSPLRGKLILCVYSYFSFFTLYLLPSSIIPLFQIFLPRSVRISGTCISDTGEAGKTEENEEERAEKKEEEEEREEEEKGRKRKKEKEEKKGREREELGVVV